MIIIKKIVVLSALALVVTVGLVITNSQVLAQNTAKPNPFSSLVQMIADKFHLNKDDVQAVFTQYREQQKQNREQNMQQREQNRLDKLVQDNKITTAQKQAILDELNALKNKYNPENNKNLTPDQRKQQFQDMQNEIKSWAQSQGIDPSYVMGGFGMGGMKGGRMGFGKWLKPSPSPTSG